MSTSLTSVAPQAPGTIVNTRTSGSIPLTIASFSTAYVLVETTPDVSPITFPFNEPVQIINLDDYVNLIGGKVPSYGPALVSYNAIKLLFRNSGTALVYVVRVGGVVRVDQISFPIVDGSNNAFEVVNGLTSTTKVPADDDLFYYRLFINNLPVGDYNSDGVYLGIPVRMPNNVADGSNHSNADNAAISDAIREAVILGIQKTASAYSTTYIRSYSVEINNVLGHNIHVTPRLKGQSLELTHGTSIPEIDAYFLQPSDSYVITSVTPTDAITVSDYIQTIQTSFRSEMNQGYICAPSGFYQFPKAEREALGTALENFCSDPDYSWMAIVDAGNSDLAEMEFANPPEVFSFDDDYLEGDTIKWGNTVYKFTEDYTGPNTYLTNSGSLRKLEVTRQPVFSSTDPAPAGVYTAEVDKGGTNATVYVRINSQGVISNVDFGGRLNLATLTSGLKGGLNYTTGTYTNVLLTGGSGYGAKATIVVGANKKVSTVTVTAKGYGYKIGDVLSASSATIGADGSKFSVNVVKTNLEVPTATSGYADSAVYNLINFSATIGMVSYTPTPTTVPRVRIYTTTELTQNTTTVIPAAGNNKYLKNGLNLNGRNYSLPIKVTIPDTIFGGTVEIIPAIRPGSDVSLLDLETQLSALLRKFPSIKLESTQGVIESLIYNNLLTYDEGGVNTPSRLLEDALMYSSPFGYLAYYGPYVIDLDEYKVPPSTAVVGVALRRNASEGFNQPPAGATYPLKGVLRPEFEVTKQHQLASNPKGMNAIRELPGKGVVIWGARTRSENPFFRFVNTRVILNVVIGTARSAFDYILFTAIDGRGLLFNIIKSTLDKFLYRLWLGNALFGNIPDDAYRVFCDRRNNPALDLENGRVKATIYVVPTPTLEAIEIDLVRVAIDEVGNTSRTEGFL